MSSVDNTKLEEFLGRALADMGSALSSLLVFAGHKLGLYRTLAQAGPLTAAELAEKTGTNERMIREWLSSQAAGRYVTYDAVTGRFALPAEQAFALANEDSPVFLQGGFMIISSLFKDEEKITGALRTGKGLSWADHDRGLFEGTEMFFRPNYNANLVKNWIPALDGVEEKLRKGATVADVGCGHGASTILMAKAYPNSAFTGFDYHPQSIEWAKKQAEKEGVADKTRFEVAKSTNYPGKDYDLVAFFDCLHDMDDPFGAARHVRASLKKDGTWMIVEPFANEKLEDNLNPVGRIFYSASTMVCVPNSLANNGPALGAQAGETRIKDVVMSGGFGRFRRAAQTPFNLLFEARP